MTTENNDMSTNPLSGSFGTLGDKPNVVSYAPEEADPILNAAKDILKQIPVGVKLLEILQKFNIPVKTIKGRELTYTTPDEQSIYMVLPPKAGESPELVALTLGCAIRDVEQSVRGFTKPDPELDPIEFASITFSRTLDIIVNMCQIADELKLNLGYTKPLDIVDELGHSGIYKAYKDEVGHDRMIDILVGSVHDEGN